MGLPDGGGSCPRAGQLTYLPTLVLCDVRAVSYRFARNEITAAAMAVASKRRCGYRVRHSEEKIFVDPQQLAAQASPGAAELEGPMPLHCEIKYKTTQSPYKLYQECVFLYLISDGTPYTMSRTALAYPATPCSVLP
eukprot:1584669-Rhodomonas_salina.3